LPCLFTWIPAYFNDYIMIALAVDAQRATSTPSSDSRMWVPWQCHVHSHSCTGTPSESLSKRKDENAAQITQDRLSRT